MYVSIKGSVKEVFDAAHKAAAQKALCDNIRDAVDANKSFSTKKAEKVLIELTASVSVSADDKAKPTKLKATIGIDGLLIGGTAQAFKASGNGAMDGLNLKKLDRDLIDLISSVVTDLMKNKVLPQMLKMTP
ncbi:MAG: hypothetical protein H7Z19_09165 [Chitinophagaceae bacterium]|nr:hypothetical protein [Rubrivivax sp.]